MLRGSGLTAVFRARLHQKGLALSLSRRGPHKQHENPPDPEAALCPRCGISDRPTLSPGSGPHACKASCAHCGRFLRWISLLAPAERMAHRLKARLKAMQQHPPSAAQLDFLQALGDRLSAPETMAEASERIEVLQAAYEARNSNAPGHGP